jgi:hypothetical protein
MDRLLPNFQSGLGKNTCEARSGPCFSVTVKEQSRLWVFLVAFDIPDLLPSQQIGQLSDVNKIQV